MRGITVGELREAMERMDDSAPVMILRGNGNNPAPIHCRSVLHGLVIEIDDSSIDELEDHLREHYEAEYDQLVRKLKNAEAELAKLKPETTKP